jgi:putative ABC transport system permease protein
LAQPPDSSRLTPGRVVMRSLRFYWGANVAVALGIAVATAVLGGSLLVGDSVRGTLRDLALQRLGRVDCALSAGLFVREGLADDLARAAPAPASQQVVGMILTEGVAKAASSGELVPQVTIIGVRDDFWSLGSMPPPHLEDRRVTLNATLAAELGAKPGDALILTMGREGNVSPATVFGERQLGGRTRSARVTVSSVIPDGGLSNFSLRNDNPRPRNAFVSLSWLQRELNRREQVNTLLAVSTDVRALESALAKVATLDEYGLRVLSNVDHRYLSLESRALTLPPGVVDAARQAATESGLLPNVTSVYLANNMRVMGHMKTDEGVPYSTIAAIEPVGAPFEPMVMADGKPLPALGPDDVFLNAWAAQDMAAEVGQQIEIVTYASGEHGDLSTVKRAFTLRGIKAMSGPAGDPGLVPVFEGITNARTIRDWNPPFPIDLKRIRPKDEEFWDKYRATPKAFVSLEAMKRIWQEANPGMPGWVTSVRLGAANTAELDGGAATFGANLISRLNPSQVGLHFRPVREEALAASKGTQDFGILFLGMSFFLVAAAAGLVALLMRLTVERRASQYGIFEAAGIASNQARRIVMWEGVCVAAAGTVVGTAMGVGYACLILYALRTLWTGAAGGLPLTLHVKAASLAAGGGAGFIAGLFAISWATRVLQRSPVLMLLAGWRALVLTQRRAAWRKRGKQGGIAAATGAVLLLALGFAGVIPPTGAFFGGGALALAALLALVSAQLFLGTTTSSAAALSLGRLAWRDCTRNPLRSLLTVGLVACAAFVIVAVAANRRDLSRLDTRNKQSGAGGYSIIAQSAFPLYSDLGSSKGRQQLGFSAETSSSLSGIGVIGLRETAGDDVSCLNAQRPAAPRVMGVPKELIARGGFTFAAFLGRTAEEKANPWLVLEGNTAGGAIPAIADAASAQWNLHAGLGDEVTVPGVEGRPVRLRITGLLADSVFAGALLVSEENLRLHFGQDHGFNRFLIDAPPGTDKEVLQALHETLGRYGFVARRSADVLAAYADVQNTYLAAFLTLGGLGLLLGTFGIVTVLLRGILERRGELAMLLALGLRPRQLGAMIVFENVMLLLIGIIVGSVSALISVAPHLASALADVNWISLAGGLLACILVGLSSCALATALALRGNLLSALRSE